MALPIDCGLALMSSGPLRRTIFVAGEKHTMNEDNSNLVLANILTLAMEARPLCLKSALVSIEELLIAPLTNKIAQNAQLEVACSLNHCLPNVGQRMWSTTSHCRQSSLLPT